MGRTCKVCKQEKELSCFPKNGKDRNGNTIYRPECKPCHSEAKKLKYATDGKTATKQKEQKRHKYITDLEWKKEKLLKSNKWQSEKYANDPGWRKKNNERGYQWKKTPQGKAMANAASSAYRARLKQAPTIDGVNALEKEFRLNMKFCNSCGTQDQLTLDHVVPLAKGGTHTPENWQCLCLRCNSSKSAKV